MSSNQSTNNSGFGSRTPPESDGPGDARIETWTALLARWTSFARAAVALPEGEGAERWRRAVVPIITLQAVVHALGELERLPDGERALAVDRAGVLIREHAGALGRAWGAEPMPESLLELIEDAQRAHGAAAALGAHWVVAEDRVVMPALDGLVARLLDEGFGGDVFAALPGTILFRGEPALFARPAPPGVDPSLDGLVEAEGEAPPLQVYRQADPETGSALRDVVAPLLTALPPGRPLLVPIVEGGRVVFDLPAHDAAGWEAEHGRAIGTRLIEVRWETGGG